jgi:hypothetical protein
VTLTISPTTPGSRFGYGLYVRLSSDFVGPLQASSYFQLAFYTDAGHTNFVKAFLGFTQYPTSSYYLGTRDLFEQSNNPSIEMRDGDLIYAQCTLNGPSSTIDSGSASGTWDTTAGLHRDIEYQLSLLGAGGGDSPTLQRILAAVTTSWTS